MFTSDRQRLAALALILIVTPLAILISTIYVLYTQTMGHWKDWLTDAVRQDSTLIQTLVRHEQDVAAQHPVGDWQASVLNQIAEIQRRFVGFGKTGESVLAWREGDEVRFLHQRHHRPADRSTAPTVVPLDGERSQAMKAALRGESGFGVFPDYRGVKVLAAYAPVPGTAWGAVIKVDLAEARAPFVSYGLAAVGVAGGLLPLGILLFRRISTTIIRNLEATAARLQDMLDSAAEGICDVDVNGRLTFANPTALRVLGWRLDEVVGANSHRLYHHSREDGSPYPEEECPLTRTIVDGNVRQIRGDLFWRKDGTSFFVDCTIAPKYRDGKIAGGVLVFQDVTNRVAAERGMVQANLDLNRQNEEMEQFIYTVSHDLKSPLVTLEGFAAHIRKDAAQDRFDRIDDFTGRIESAVGRMRNLIDGLLGLSRIGRVPAEGQIIDTRELVAQLVRQQQAQIDAKGVSVTVDPDLPPLFADRLRVTQLFENLIVNALRYGCGAPRPSIAIGHRVEAGEVRYFVRDNGVGIAAEHHERVFQLFERLSADRDGTGVGLAIVRKVMEVHQGRAWVESQPGGGATFWIAFPGRSAKRGPLASPDGGSAEREQSPDDAGSATAPHAVSAL